MAIEFSGEYRIAAPQQRVWEALNDPAVLQASIAGCRQLDKVDGNAFNAIVVAKVGPISATFRGHVELSEVDAPRSYVLTGRGQGGASGFASMQARVTLREEAGETLLHYTASAEIGGKLASVGSRLVQTVAKKNADDFFSAFAAHFGVRPTVAPMAAASVHAADDMPSTAGVRFGGGGLDAPVPAWLVVFGTALGCALGYCVALLR